MNGTYYVRQVIYAVQTGESTDASLEGTVNEAINMQGTITFDGNGNYNFSGSLLDAGVGTVQTGVTVSGTYVISASGMGYITAINPEVTPTDQIIGLVSHGIFIGSTTGNTEAYNDLFIAAPVGSVATNATLKGTYRVAYMDPTYFNPSTSALPGGDATFTMTADGQGNIGNVSVQGYVSDNFTQSTENLGGVTYSFSNGAAQLNLGGSNTALVQGTELLYISPDGNFIFGGNYNGYDMFVGVRAATSNPPSYQGLYYQAGIDLDQSPAANGFVLFDTYYGAINVFSGNIIGHQSLNSQLTYGGAADFTYYDNYSLGGNGSSSDVDYDQTYWSSPDGSIRIGYGVPDSSTGFDSLSLNVALRAPSFSGSGVYLNPVGFENAASSAPFTAHLSPGEYLTLVGTGLAPSDASAGAVPLPDSLNGVQVMINQRPAPLDFVSPTQINLVVPYFTESIAQIQVINNGAKSNVITQFVGATSAGVFTYDPVGGIGSAAAQHSDYAVVSTDNPAQITETVAVFVSGMGAVSPAVDDGVAPSSSPLSKTPALPVVYLTDSAGNSEQATVSFSGLAPGYPGLYQINVVIPSGLVTSPATLEIIGLNSGGGPDSDTLEAVIPFTAAASDATPAARAKAGARARIHHHRLARPTTLSSNQR